KKTVVSFVCLFLLSAFWFLTTLNDISTDFGYQELSYIILFIVSVLAAEAVFLFVVCFFFRERARNSVCAALLVVNLFLLYLVFIPGLEKWSWLKWGVIAVSVPAAYMFFLALSETGRFRTVILCVCAVLCGIEVADFVRWRFVTVQEALPLSVGETTSAKNVRIVEFSRKPNVYFISFDAMIPETLAGELIGLQTLPYQRFMEEKGFAIFKNGFSDGMPTLASLSRFLAMDQEHYSLLESKGRQFSLLSGIVPSPLFEIFRANGYGANVYFYDHQGGGYKGPHVDSYETLVYEGFCWRAATAGKFARSFGFFGWCEFISADWLPDFIIKDMNVKKYLPWRNIPVLVREDILGGVHPGDRQVVWAHLRAFYLKFALDQIRSRIQEGPQVFFMYMVPPIHVHPDRRIIYEKRRGEGYIKNEFSRLFAYGARVRKLFMSDILHFIERKDPGALVYFFGDHGALVTDGRKDLKGNERESVLDNYGILHGLRPADACREYLADSPEFEKFSIPAMVARGIIRCLADGADPFVQPAHFRLWPNNVEKYSKVGYIGPPGSYEEYVYE
ncbi:MAG: hypothetical protein OXF45_00465, partial [Candidatus Dadabacteria bacterium]|nr:hypothetical protein [Candidatus Dadabacteria bacterium]